MTKTAICADLHLNNANFGRIDKNGLSFRTKDFMAAFEFFVDQCVNVIKPDRVVILGDVYENPNPSNPVRRFFNRMLKRLSKAGIKVEIIVGNHDSCFFSHALQPVEEAGFENVTIRSEAEMVVENDCAMIFLPHTESVERREKTHKIQVKEFGIKNAVEISTAKMAGLPVLAFGHFGVYGVEMNDGVLNHNKEDVSLGDLADLGADGIFLGHFHMDQELNVSGALRSMYVGSLERSSYNDKAESKSFVVVSIDRGKKFEVSRVEYTGARKMVTVSGNAQQITDGIDKIKANLEDGDVEPIVKLKFVGSMTEYAEFCKTKKTIRDNLGWAKHVSFEKDVKDQNKINTALSVKDNIADRSDVGIADLLEILTSHFEACVADLDDRKAIIDISTSVIKAVKDKKLEDSGVLPGRTRIHGVKLNNFQRYGTDNNIVEFDAGCKGFFGRSWSKVDDWAAVSVDSRAFLDTLSDEDRKLISIVGKIDGNGEESNGSGKSSILDAISWVFYEKIVRDFFDKESSKGSSTMSVVRTVDGKPERECFVEVLFSAGESLYFIRRERKCSSSDKHSGDCLLYCLYSPEGSADSGTMMGHRGDDAEKFIVQLVSMDFDTFSNSVMFGQSDADKFIRGTDKIKKEIFVKILGLVIIDEYLKETRARASLVDKELTSLQAQSTVLIANSMTKEEELAAEKTIEDYKRQALEQREKIAALEAAIVTLRSDSVFTEKVTVDSEIEVLKSQIKQHSEESERAGKTAREAVEQESSRLLKFQQTLAAVEKELNAAKKSDTELKTSINSFDEVDCKKNIKYGEEAVKAKPKRDAQKSELTAKRDSILLRSAKYVGIINSLETSAAKFRKALEKMGDCESAPCPECENPVSKQHLESKVKALEDEQAKVMEDKTKNEEPLEQIKKEIADIQIKLENIEDYTKKGQNSSKQLVLHEANKTAKSAINTRIEEIEKRRDGVLDSIKTSEKSLVDLRLAVTNQTSGYLNSISTLQSKLDDSTLRMNKFILPRKTDVENKIAANEVDIKNASIVAGNMDSGVAATSAKIEVSRKTADKIIQISQDIVGKTKEQTRLGVVENAFGLDGIRVQIIEKYIPLLNLYIGEFMDVISDKMSAEVITDGKKDGKMEIRVNGSSGSDPRQLSKGQFAKLKVATDLALGMISLARNENAPDFVCLDEVFAPVDASGKRAMFDVIAKLQEYFRMVLVISHDPLIQETIKDTIIVNMINDVSTIEKQAYEH